MGLMLRPPPGTPGSALPAILIGLFVAFGGILFGFVLLAVFAPFHKVNTC